MNKFEKLIVFIAFFLMGLSLSIGMVTLSLINDGRIQAVVNSMVVR